MPGALWTREHDRGGARRSAAPALRRIVVAIDPAVTSGEDADETGIVVAGLGADGHGYVLDDLSGRYRADASGRARAVDAYRAHRADRIVAEVNNGGEMVEATLRMVDRERRATRRCTRAAARRRAPSRSRRSTSRAGSTTSARFPRSRTRCAPFTADFDRGARGTRPTASTRWSGR